MGKKTVLLVFTSREKFLHLLPKGGVVAEIGTFRGDFSQAILDNAEPECLHLIDPWDYQEKENYQVDESNVSKEEHEENFDHVRQIFKKEIAAGRIVLHRKMSVDAAKDFPDRTFDWIYVDGDHTYDAVSADLETFAPKVKQGGLILGHDYANYPGTGDLNYGVIEAVDAFLSSLRFNFLALTAEGHATFVLGDSSDTVVSDNVAARVIYNVSGVVEIRNFSGKKFRQRVVEFPDDERRLLTSV